MRTASSSAGWPSSITVRCPTGFRNPVRRPRLMKPSRSPRAAVVLPRFCPVAARYSWRTGALAPSGRLALDQGDGIAQPGDPIGVDGVRLEVRAEALHDVGDQAQEH